MPIRRPSSEGKPLLDIASYARRGPGCRDHLPLTEIELISRTVSRTPEVMVKVLTRGGRDLTAVRRHLQYLDRKGELNFETDDGQLLAGKGTERELLEDWDLDIEEDRRRATLEARPTNSPPKLVHKILFSMPPGTPPGKVLEAVKNFAKEEFALKHRYAMVLHTDEPHPHVHMVIKALSEQGVRLNIRKETLRQWRRSFAEHLRRQGVAANATERAVRGGARTRKSDAIYRANLRGESTHMWDRKGDAVSAPHKGNYMVEEGKRTLVATRKKVEEGWHALGDILATKGLLNLAANVRQFIRELPAPLTEAELLAAETRNSGREPRAPEPPMTR